MVFQKLTSQLPALLLNTVRLLRGIQLIKSTKMDLPPLRTERKTRTTFLLKFSRQGTQNHDKKIHTKNTGKYIKIILWFYIIYYINIHMTKSLRKHHYKLFERRKRTPELTSKLRCAALH